MIGDQMIEIFAKKEIAYHRDFFYYIVHSRCFHIVHIDLMHPQRAILMWSM